MPSKPNIVFLFPDQLRFDFLSCYGARFIDTPNIDRIAAQGACYQRAYSAHPVCVPARASLMVGMHALKTGVLDNGQALRPDYGDCGLQTWPEILNDQGYYTAAIGKMHFYPWDARLGFQYRSIAEDKRWLYVRDDYYHYLKAHGERRHHGKEHPGYLENKGAIINLLPWELSVDHFVGMEACRFIREHGTEGPFAMMVGFPGPHCPYDPTPEFATFKPEDMPLPVPEVPGDTPRIREGNIRGNLGPWNGVDLTEFTVAQQLKVRAHYAGLVKAIDYEVGQILDALAQQGVLDNTIIIFASDHGDYLGDHNLAGKGQYYDASPHVPMLVRLPQAQQGSVCNDLVMLTDVTATMVHLAGCAVPGYMDAAPLPGLGIANATPRDHILGALGGAWMYDDGEWRLHRYGTGEALLFNIREDPQEQHNLIRDPRYLDTTLRLEAALTQEVMHLQMESYWDRRVYVRDLSQSDTFGREGWQRTYPRRAQDR